MNRILLLLLAGILAASSALAEDVLLQNTFRAGERAEMSLVADVTGTLSNQPIEWTFKLMLDMQTSQVFPDGSAEVAVDLRSLSLEGTAQGKDIKQAWDKAKLDSLGLSGAPLRLTVSPQGEVRSVTGLSELSSKIPEWLDFRAYFVEGEMLFASLPNRALKQGESWTTPAEVSIPFTRGKARATVQRTMEEISAASGERRAVIHSVSTMSTDGAPGADPEVISGVQLKSCTQKVDTRLVFDIEAGHVVETRQKGTFQAVMIPVQPAGLNTPPSELSADMQVDIQTQTKYF